MSTAAPDALLDEPPPALLLLLPLLLQPATARAAAAARAAIAGVRLMYLPLVDLKLSGCHGAHRPTGPGFIAVRQPRYETSLTTSFASAVPCRSRPGRPVADPPACRRRNRLNPPHARARLSRSPSCVRSRRGEFVRIWPSRHGDELARFLYREISLGVTKGSRRDAEDPPGAPASGCVPQWGRAMSRRCRPRHHVTPPMSHATPCPALSAPSP